MIAEQKVSNVFVIYTGFYGQRQQQRSTSTYGYQLIYSGKPIIGA